MRMNLNGSSVTRLGLFLAAAALAAVGCAKDPKQGCDALTTAVTGAVSASTAVPAKASEVDALVKQLTDARERLSTARANLVNSTISVDAVHLEQRIDARIALLRKAFAPVAPAVTAAPAAAPAPAASASAAPAGSASAAPAAGSASAAPAASAAPVATAAPEAPKPVAPDTLPADVAAKLKENTKSIEAARDEALAGCQAK